MIEAGPHAVAGDTQAAAGELHAAGGEENLAGETAVHHSDPLEYLLMALSVGIALAGIALAHRFYVRDPTQPGRLAERARGVYATLYNKYWVDELYGATVVGGTRAASRFLGLFDAYIVDGIVNGTGYLTRGASWTGGAIDRYIVDGLVNAVGKSIRLFGGGASRLQTGVIQNYVLAVFGGVIVLVLILRFV